MEEGDAFLPSVDRRSLLLYFNKDTFLSKENEMIGIIQVTKEEGIDIVLVQHEQEAAEGCCPFSHIIENTAAELLDRPVMIFKDTLTPHYRRGEYRKISCTWFC